MHDKGNCGLENEFFFIPTTLSIPDKLLKTAEESVTTIL